MIELPKKIKLGLKIFGMCIGLTTMLSCAEASIKKDLPTSTTSDTFPTSYESYIDKLKEIYPNATFKAVYTGLDWDTVIKHESYEIKTGISLVPSSYSDVWKKDGKNIYVDGNFVVASKSAVAYVIDPRNSLYEREVFQFEGLSYNPNITTSVVEKVIVSSPMVGTYAKKYKNAGQWIDMDMSYAEIINQVGKEQGVSSVYIASRMLQETSGDIVNNGSINGSNATYPGIYNFFNIGATPNADGTGSVTNGLKYAASQGWTTPYLSITGGVKEIKSSYIKYGQDTVYFQKFDVNNPYGNASALMAYQYQTNIMAPTSESRISYKAYSKLDMLDTAFTFYIPVYNNMPQDPAPYPAGDSAKFVGDNTKVYLDDELDNGTDVFNIRSSASSELDNIIYTIKETKEGADNRTILTRTKKGDGYDWDYVELTVDGQVIKGYVWKDHVKEYTYTKVESVELDRTELTLEIGETYTLTANINPTGAKYKEVNWKSQDENIASIEGGKITANNIGTTTVTVMTVEGEKTATCTVTVIENRKDILLDKEEYVVVVNEKIKPVITLKNIESYELKIADETIACLVEDEIQGLMIGETTLEVTSVGLEQPIVKTVKINVIEAPQEGYVLHESLNLSEAKLLTNVTPKTILSDIKSKIELTNLTLVIKDVNGKELTDNAYVGTGTTLTFLKENNTEYDKLTLAICGDVTGDGLINSADLLKTVKYLKGTSTVNEFAADVTKDGEINSADLLKTVKYLKGTSTIDFK
ncbi:MAG: Ig-like domain-containing protein [Clostridia bacterium]|nr:Ig-like domain-containing protein [Clostridia bacterium]